MSSAYAEWDWDQFKPWVGFTGGTGLSVFEPIRYDPITKNESEAGYTETSPENTKGIWIFRMEFLKIIPSAYIYMVDFYHQQRGGVPFYFTWPFALAGVPNPVLATPGGSNPWYTEIETGAGEGPNHLVRWLQNEFPVKRLDVKNNYWVTSGVIEFRQV